MGALDQVLSEVQSRFGISESKASSLLSGLLSLINGQADGVTGFFDRFKRPGLGNWLSSSLQGETKPLDGETVASALGRDATERIAANSGLSFSAAAAAIGFMLPKVLQKVAPGGTVPSRLPSELTSYISGPTAAVNTRASEAGYAPEQIVVKEERSRPHFLLPLLALLIGAVLVGWLYSNRRPTVNTSFNAAEQVRLAQNKARAALASLKPGFGGQDLTNALNLNVINFAPGSAQIPQESYDFLNKATAAIKAAPSGTHLEVAGHTDNTGDDASNMSLSRQRADTVRNYLIQQGVDPNELVAAGYGQTKPVATNATEEGRFRNRRIEFTVLN